MVDDEYRRLAERLLAFPNPDGTLPSVQLLPGRLPDDSLLRVPLAANSTVIGTSIRWQRQGPPHIDVVLSVPREVPDILAFYERELGQLGWNPAAWPSHSAPGGFISSGVGRPHYFSRGEDGPILVLSLAGQEDGHTEVRVRTQDPFPKSDWARMSRLRESVPVLRPPVGVQLWGDGGGGSEHRWTSEAVAQTEMSPAELESHLARQLIGAGWTRVEQGACGPMACSTWIVPGEEGWYGLLVVAEAPGKARRAILLKVDSGTRTITS